MLKHKEYTNTGDTALEQGSPATPDAIFKKFPSQFMNFRALPIHLMFGEDKPEAGPAYGSLFVIMNTPGLDWTAYRGFDADLVAAKLPAKDFAMFFQDGSNGNKEIDRLMAAYARAGIPFTEGWVRLGSGGDGPLVYSVTCTADPASPVKTVKDIIDTTPDFRRYFWGDGILYVSPRTMRRIGLTPAEGKDPASASLPGEPDASARFNPNQPLPPMSKLTPSTADELVARSVLAGSGDIKMRIGQTGSKTADGATQFLSEAIRLRNSMSVFLPTIRPKTSKVTHINQMVKQAQATKKVNSFYAHALAALAANESAWDPTATNKASGASSVLQFLPSTIADLKKRYALPSFKSTDPTVVGQYAAALVQALDSLAKAYWIDEAGNWKIKPNHAVRKAMRAEMGSDAYNGDYKRVYCLAYNWGGGAPHHATARKAVMFAFSHLLAVKAQPGGLK